MDKRDTNITNLEKLADGILEILYAVSLAFLIVITIPIWIIPYLVYKAYKNNRKG